MGYDLAHGGQFNGLTRRTHSQPSPSQRTTMILYFLLALSHIGSVGDAIEQSLDTGITLRWRVMSGLVAAIWVLILCSVVRQWPKNPITTCSVNYRLANGYPSAAINLDILLTGAYLLGALSALYLKASGNIMALQQESWTGARPILGNHVLLLGTILFLLFLISRLKDSLDLRGGSLCQTKTLSAPCCALRSRMGKRTVHYCPWILVLGAQRKKIAHHRCRELSLALPSFSTSFIPRAAQLHRTRKGQSILLHMSSGLTLILLDVLRFFKNPFFVRDLRAELAQSERKEKGLQQRLLQCEGREKQLRQRLSIREVEFGDRFCELHELFQRLIDENTDLVVEMNHRESEFRELERKVEHLENGEASLQVALDRCLRNHEVSCEQVTALCDILDDRIARHDELESRSQEANQLQRDLDCYIEKESSLRKENEQLRMEIDQKQLKYQEQLDEAHGIIRDRIARVDELEGQFKREVDKHEEVEQLRMELLRKDIEWLEQLDRTHRLVQIKSERLDDAYSKIKREEQLRKEADAQVKQLEREHVQAREFHKVYEGHIAALLKAKHEALDENNTMRAQLEELRQFAKYPGTDDDSVQSLREKLRKAETENDELFRELVSTRASYDDQFSRLKLYKAALTTTSNDTLQHMMKDNSIRQNPIAAGKPEDDSIETIESQEETIEILEKDIDVEATEDESVEAAETANISLQSDSVDISSVLTEMRAHDLQAMDESAEAAQTADISLQGGSVDISPVLTEMSETDDRPSIPVIIIHPPPPEVSSSEST
ncbi:hypothetical protein AcV7_008623 [Taiwanofungus camphoratus]|nr:hypothetical protein AcV7_008623 [Antrodia cinnamomea]